MELYQIKYFLAVAELLNFTKAAEKSNVSQPSLTRAIKKLESELGGELFRRERSRTHLTDLGREMLPFLQQSFDSAVAAKKQAENFGKGIGSPLHLGISATLEIQLLLPALRQLVRAMPAIRLHIIRKPAAEIMQKLEDGEIEVCLTAIDDSIWERIDRWSLFNENFMLLVNASNPLASNTEIELPHLSGQNMIIRADCEHADSVAKIIDECSVQGRCSHQISDQSDFSAVVAGGLGVGIVPKSTTVPAGAISIPLKDLPIQRTVSLFAVSGRRYSLAASGFIRLLRSADWSSFENQTA